MSRLSREVEIPHDLSSTGASEHPCGSHGRGVAGLPTTRDACVSCKQPTRLVGEAYAVLLLVIAVLAGLYARYVLRGGRFRLLFW